MFLHPSVLEYITASKVLYHPRHIGRVQFIRICTNYFNAFISYFIFEFPYFINNPNSVHRRVYFNFMTYKKVKFAFASSDRDPDITIYLSEYNRLLTPFINFLLLYFTATKTIQFDHTFGLS